VKAISYIWLLVLFFIIAGLVGGVMVFFSDLIRVHGKDIYHALLGIGFLFVFQELGL